MRRGIATASIASMALALCVAATPAASAATAPEVQEVGMLFVQTADRGTLDKLKGRPLFRLTLRDVSPQVVWFMDRPAHSAGHIPIRGFVDAWSGFGFTKSRPNAALTLLHGDREADTAVFKLSKPQYRKGKRTLGYIARRIPEATGNLSQFESQRDPRLPHRFRATSLFIDNAYGDVVNGCLLEPYTRCEGVDLSYVELEGGDLSGADFSGASFFYADLGSSNFSGANLSGADLSYASADTAKFSDVDLSGASLWKAFLEGTNLRRANLTNADLRWSKLGWVDLTGADLTGADLFYATFCHTTMPDGSINNASC